MDDLRRHVPPLAPAILMMFTSLQNTIANLEKRISASEDRAEYAENRGRRKNLIFFGVPEEEGENWDNCREKVRDFAKKVGVDLHRRGVERAHRLDTRERPRPLIALFSFWEEKEEVLAKSDDIRKKTGVSVAPDFAPRTREARKALKPIFKDAKRKGRPAKLALDVLHLGRRGSPDSETLVYDHSVGQVIDATRRGPPRPRPPPPFQPLGVRRQQQDHQQPWGASRGHQQQRWSAPAGPPPAPPGAPLVPPGAPAGANGVPLGQWRSNNNADKDERRLELASFPELQSSSAALAPPSTPKRGRDDTSPKSQAFAAGFQLPKKTKSANAEGVAMKDLLDMSRKLDADKRRMRSEFEAKERRRESAKKKETAEKKKKQSEKKRKEEAEKKRKDEAEKKKEEEEAETKKNKDANEKQTKVVTEEDTTMSAGNEDGRTPEASIASTSSTDEETFATPSRTDQPVIKE